MIIIRDRKGLFEKLYDSVQRFRGRTGFEIL